jgi:hypothetical protein
VRDRLSGTTERVSGAQAGGFTDAGAISADGRFVTFQAGTPPNRPGGDIGGIFVRDRAAGTTERVSVSSDGAPSDGYDFSPSISADGRIVAFGSAAMNLTADHTNGVFVRDRLTRTTTLISVALPAPANTRSPSIPANGHAGELIACDPGTWTGSPSFTFTWIRDDNVIAGQTNVAYGLTDDDVGHTIRCRVTAHNAGGNSSADSNELVATRLRPEPGRLLLRPWPPRAGKQLRTTMPVTAAGAPVTAGRLACAATLAGRRLIANEHRFRAGSALCEWKIPKTARRERLKGSLTVTTPDGTASRSFAGTVR